MTSPLLANVRPGDSRNYGVAKRASLWFNPVSDGSDAGWLEFGNLVDLSAVPDISQLEHESNRRGARTRDRIEISQVKMDLKCKLDELSITNLMKVFGGSAGKSSSTVTLRDGKIVTNPGGGESISLGSTGLATVIVRDTKEEGSPVTYTEDAIATDTTDDTAGGTWNNTTDPLTIAAASYPGTPTSVGALIKVESEIMKVTAFGGGNITLARGQLGTTAATHANGVNIYKCNGTDDYVADLTNGVIYILLAAGLNDESAIPEIHVYFTKSVSTERFQIFDGTPIRGQAQYQVLTASGARIVITLPNVTLQNDGELSFGTGEKWVEMPISLEALSDSSGVLGYFHFINVAATF